MSLKRAGMWLLGGCMAVILVGAVVAVVTLFFWLQSV